MFFPPSNQIHQFSLQEKIFIQFSYCENIQTESLLLFSLFLIYSNNLLLSYFYEKKNVPVAISVLYFYRTTQGQFHRHTDRTPLIPAKFQEEKP